MTMKPEIRQSRNGARNEKTKHKINEARPKGGRFLIYIDEHTRPHSANFFLIEPNNLSCLNKVF